MKLNTGRGFRRQKTLTERKLTNKRTYFLFRDADDRGKSTGRCASSVHGFGSPLLRINTGITDTSLFDSQSSSAGIMVIMQGRRSSRPEYPDVAGRTWNLAKRCWDQDPELWLEVGEVLQGPAVVSPSLTSPPVHQSDCVLMHNDPPAWKQLITPARNVFY